MSRQKRGPGRPELPAAKAKGAIFSVRLTRAERAAVEEVAKSAEKKASAWVRELILSVTSGDAKEIMEVVTPAIVRGGALKRAASKAREELAPTPEGPTCSFCGEPQSGARKLVAGPKVFICEECVRLALDIVGPVRS
jgi:hypothetical protein